MNTWKKNGETKMKKPSNIIFLGIAMIALGITIIFINRVKNPNTLYRQYDRMRYLRDSVEMEYYKKELSSFPENHSEIKDTTVKGAQY